MFETLVNEVKIAPGQLEMHQQSVPFPGGARYKIVATDEELVRFFYDRYSQMMQMPTPDETSHIFNLVRLHISLTYDRTEPLYWANTIDQMLVREDVLELAGVCSPNVEQ